MRNPLRTILPCALALGLTPAAFAQVVEDFESGNPMNWAFDPGSGVVTNNGTVQASGGSPGAYLQFSAVSNVNFPVSFLMPESPTADWTGNFRARGITGASFDYRQNAGFPNFGWHFNLVLGDDNGTPNMLADDVMAVVYTGSFIQIADQTWHTASVAIPADSTLLPAGWSIFSYSGTNSGNDDADWNAIIQSVDYVAIATDHPSVPAFGTVDIDFDTIALEVSEVGTPYCFCDGSGTIAPCANTGAGGNGCGNGTAPGGAHLTGLGSTSVSGPPLSLVGSGLVPNQPGLYFQGDNRIAGGAGVAFGDGLRCAGGGIVRLQVVTADQNGESATSVDVAVRGGVSAGQTKRYQLWYRDPVGSPCATGFNLTNGLEVVWAP